jgi:flagellar biosynthesis protein FlhF
MKLETFRGAVLQQALASARRALGDDAMIVRTRSARDGVEVVAVRPDELSRYRARLLPEPLPDLTTRLGRRADRPWLLALVGPTGAGKTTTLAKLAIHPQAFGALKVGLLSLDTYRVGALEQLEMLAEIARLQMEVVYAPAEVPGALQRLQHCDVVLVDTPGRSPKEPALNAEWGALLRAMQPDETHLVLPASIRTDIGVAVHRAYEPHGVTHLLLSKLDEVPGEVGVTSLSLAIELPARWVTDGQEIPSDLRPAPARILASLGLQPEAAA